MIIEIDIFSMNKRKSPVVRAMERFGAAEVLLVCEGTRTMNVIAATVFGKVHSKLTPIEKDARETLDS